MIEGIKMENKICQSCGMPITSNEQLGTNVLVLMNVLVGIIRIVLVKIQNAIVEKKLIKL